MHFECRPCTNPTWTQFIANHPDAAPFHHLAWVQLLSDCYGYRAFALALSGDAGQIIAGLPAVEVRGLGGKTRWVSLPFTDYCPPLVENSAALTALTDVLVNRRNLDRLAAIEVRASLPDQKGLFLHSDAVRHTLGLSPNCDVVHGRFCKMHQRNIRKAEHSGVRIEWGYSLAAVSDFYQLHLKTRQRLGTPIQPFRFFRLMSQRLIENGLGIVLLARQNDKPIAAAIFLTSNGTIIYKYGASDPAYWGYRPNNLLFWTAIKWGCENGYHTFDFGRTDLEDEGLRNFKNGWGAEEKPLVYSVIADGPPRPSSGRVYRWMGAVIRHSPPLVCRVLGELFYKYAA